MARSNWLIQVSLLLMMVPVGSFAETMPVLRGESFADVRVDLPAGLHGRVGILVLGFSKKSSAQTKLWNEALMPDFGSDPRVAYYEAAVLADVPWLFRGTVVKGIRSGMAPAERAHFVPILEDAGKWKDATHYSAADDAYVLVTDGAGQIEFRVHGAPTSEVLGRVRECVATLRGR